MQRTIHLAFGGVSPNSAHQHSNTKTPVYTGKQRIASIRFIVNEIDENEASRVELKYNVGHEKDLVSKLQVSNYLESDEASKSTIRSPASLEPARDAPIHRQKHDHLIHICSLI